MEGDSFSSPHPQFNHKQVKSALASHSHMTAGVFGMISITVPNSSIQQLGIQAFQKELGEKNLKGEVDVTGRAYKTGK